MRIPRRRAGLVLALLAAAGGATAESAGEASRTGAPGEGAGLGPGPEAPLARIGEELLRVRDVAPDVAFRIYRLRVDIHSLLRSETERLVEQRLLEREAARRDTTPEALVEAAMDEAAPVTEAEVEAWIAEHPGEGQGSPEQVRARIRHFLGETRRIEKRLALLERLRAQADYAWLLEPPEPPRVRIDIEGAPARGPADAPVVAVQFASFGSEASARLARNLAALQREFPDALRVVHRNFLRPGDEMGLVAAQLGFLAAEQGRFWEFHDAAFVREGRLDPESLAAAARKAGLPEGAPDPADTGGLLARVKRDQELAQRLGVPREPTLFMNGLYVPGTSSLESLRSALQEELKGAQRD